MKISRLEENPIIKPKMFGKLSRFFQGRNINGPTLIKVPNWIKNPLGRYYLYFGHHQGKYIRLAYSNFIEGPYTIYKPGTLTINYKFLANHHIASPEIFINETDKSIWMYFHANIRGIGEYEDQGQMTYLAKSEDGINFHPINEQLAPFYLRVFRYDGYFYGIAKNDNTDAILVRSKNGESNFVRGPQFMPKFRHCALHLRGDELHVIFSRAFDTPEVLLYSKMKLEGNWKDWNLSKPEIILKPEKEWEGVNLPITQSKYGGTGRAHALRDPYIFQEGGKLFLLYSIMGENGIGIARIEDL